MAQLLRRCFEPRTVVQGKIMNVPVFYYEVNMVLQTLLSNVQRVRVMHEMHEP